MIGESQLQLDPQAIGVTTSILIGLTHGAALSIVIGCLTGALIAFLAHSGLLVLGGQYPEMAIATLPIYALPGGVVGGIASGSLRGTRLKISATLASIPAFVIGISGLAQSAPISGMVVILVSLVLVALAGTLACNRLIRMIIRTRNSTIAALEADPTSSPGQVQTIASIGLTLLLIVGIAFAVGARGNPGLFTYLLGLVAGAGVVNTLVSLRLVGAYPNRASIGSTTASISFLATVFAALIAASSA